MFVCAYISNSLIDSFYAMLVLLLLFSSEDILHVVKVTHLPVLPVVTLHAVAVELLACVLTRALLEVFRLKLLRIGIFFSILARCSLFLLQTVLLSTCSVYIAIFESSLIRPESGVRSGQNGAQFVIHLIKQEREGREAVHLGGELVVRIALPQLLLLVFFVACLRAHVLVVQAFGPLAIDMDQLRVIFLALG